MWGAAPTGRAVRTLAIFAAFAAFAAVSTALAQAADAQRGPLYVSKQGSHRSACTKSRPCKSFGRAYDLARPGQVVLVRGGHYRAQRIRFDRKGSGRDVIFRPATQRKVFVAGLLDIQWAQHLEVRGLHVNAWRTVGARDVIFRSVVTKWFSIQGGDGVRVLGGRAGPALNRSNRITATTHDSPHAPTSVRIDGLIVQGYRRTSAGPSVGCLDVRAVDGLVIRNSRVFDCSDFGIRFPASDPAGPAQNAVVENNIVSCCRLGTDAISFDGDPSTRWVDILIRNNSVVGTLSAGSGYLSEVGVYANIASEFIGCGQLGLVADYNVWGAGSACGAEDVVSANGFIDPGERNFELAPGAAAIDIAAVGTASRSDIDGQARPVGPTSDAGAKESRSSALVAAFPLNEVAGPSASDASGKANAGVVSGATWTSNGRFGGALSFDGANDWMTVLDNPSLDLTDAMTLEAWVKPALASSEWRTVLMKERAGGLAYGLYGDTSTGQPSGNVDVGTELDARGPSALPLNQWTHLAATYDGSSLKLFLNGRQVSSRSVSGSLMPSSSPLRLGGNSVWDEWFAGSIDEVRVYDRVLSASEVKKDMGSAIRVASDTSAPSVPLGLLATGQTATSVAVSWTASVDDNGVAGYGLYRNGALNGSTAAATYTYTGLSCGTTYTFAVDAYDSAGNRSAQSSISAATDACPPPDTTAPSAPGTFASSGATQSSISVSWDASSDNVGVSGYGLYRNGTSAGTTGVSPRTYTYSGLSCGTSYTLEVDAIDAAGNRSAKTSLSASTSACPVPDAQAPSAPGNFASTGATQTSISVSWNASSDNVGLSGYGLYRNGTSAGTTGVSPRTYTYSGLTCGTSYTLEVDAADAAGNRSAKTSLSASTSACSAPSGGANIWIDTNGGSCTDSATAVAYNDSQACSWDAANDTCEGGDKVTVKGGSYGNVTLTGSNARSSMCTFTPASGESVVMGHFNNGEYAGGDTGADWITVVGPIKATEFDSDFTNQVVIDNWDVNHQGGNEQMFHVEDSTNFTLRNSKVHNAQNANAMMVFIGAQGPWVFDNNDIYDDRDTTNGGVHTECFRADPLNNVTMTRNHFWACSTMDVFLTGSERATNWVVENNIFEKPLGPNENAFAFRSGGVPSPSPDGFVFRYNTVASGMQINNADNSPTAAGFTVYGNYFRTGAPCGLPNTTYTYNVAPTGVNCSGTGNRSFSLSSINAGFVSPHVVTSDGPTTEPAGDYTLLPTSPLIDAGTVGGYPALDRLGFARYVGGGPDVGAYEYGSN